LSRLDLDAQCRECHNQIGRRCDPSEFIWHGRHRSLRIGRSATEDPIRIAVTLIGRPRIAALIPRCDARPAHCVEETLTAEDRVVERHRESPGLFIPAGPSGCDHATYTELDQFFRHTASESSAVIWFAQL